MADPTLAGRAVDRAAHGLAALLDRLPRRRPSLAILTYHRVAPADERPDLHPGLCVEPAAFRAQLAAVARHATPVALDDLLAASTGGTPLPPRAVHVTIDDAYACVERHTWPALREAGIPATLFVPTAYPGTARTFWWDRLHHALQATDAASVDVAARTWDLATVGGRAATFRALRAAVSGLPHDRGLALVDEVVAACGDPRSRPATAGWDVLRRLGREGLGLAAHSRTHPLLHRIPADRLDDEVAGSWDDLRHQVGTLARPAFAPPGGGYDAAVAHAARRAGLGVVVTTERGVNAGPVRWDALRRINVGARTPAGVVRVQLCPQAHSARAGAAAARARVRPTPAQGGRPWR